MNFNVTKLEELIAASKINNLLTREEDDRKINRTILIILAIIGAVAAVAAISYGVYRFFFADDLEDFDEDLYLDDDDLEDFFDEEEEEEEPAGKEEAAEEEEPEKAE